MSFGGVLLHYTKTRKYRLHGVSDFILTSARDITRESNKGFSYKACSKSDPFPK